MNLNIEININQLAVIIAILSVTILFFAYHFIVNSITYKKVVTDYYGNKKAKIYSIVLQRLLGLFLFGIIPLLITLFIFPDNNFLYGLNTYNYETSIIWIIILAPVIILINFLNAGKSTNLACYPQIRKKKWTKNLVLLSAVSWITYLLAYEFMFRGFLFFSCLSVMPTSMAIALNISLYAFAHLPKGVGETLGSIPFGLILCWLTLRTGSILIPVSLHIIMALTNEWFSVRAHKKMKVI